MRGGTIHINHVKILEARGEKEDGMRFYREVVKVFALSFSSLTCDFYTQYTPLVARADL